MTMNQGRIKMMMTGKRVRNQVWFWKKSYEIKIKNFSTTWVRKVFTWIKTNLFQLVLTFHFWLTIIILTFYFSFFSWSLSLSLSLDHFLFFLLFSLWLMKKIKVKVILKIRTPKNYINSMKTLNELVVVTTTKRHFSLKVSFSLFYSLPLSLTLENSFSLAF